MIAGTEAIWQPTCVVRFDRALDTSTGTARVMTDAGPAYIKALGNRQGPHALACEFVGTKLASWFGLPTFDMAILSLDATDEIPFLRGGLAAPGPAFVTRAAKGHVWGGSSEELDLVDNPQDIVRLVVFDTWTLNCDRHPPDLSGRKPNYDNVFLSEERATAGHFCLVAMDHTHCFTCGRDLNGHIASISRTKDMGVYGLFPGFMAAVRDHRLALQAALEYLRTFDRAACQSIVAMIPPGWSVTDDARTALINLICQRAVFVADNLEEQMVARCWPQGELGFEMSGDEP